jgi:hypothetical protein
MVTGAAYYEQIITHLITTVEALDATAYRDPATVQGAGWTRARRATPAHGISQDLGFWLDLGGSVTFQRSRITHDAAIVYAVRYRPDGDVSDQARIAASARILSELLATYSGPHGVRAVPTGYSMSLPPAGDAWVQVELRFTLSLPRGA